MSYKRQKGKGQTGGVCEVQTGDMGERKTNVQQTNKGCEVQTGGNKEIMEQEFATL